MVNKAIYADADKCLACKSCELACALAHAGCDLETAMTEQVLLQPRLRVVQVEGTVSLLQCRQCEDAPCAGACPVQALYQDEGIVKLERKLCIGCKKCVKACPFGAITMTKDLVPQAGEKIRAKALKCDLCFSRTGHLAEANCACLQACPTKALTLVEKGEVL